MVYTGKTLITYEEWWKWEGTRRAKGFVTPSTLSYRQGCEHEKYDRYEGQRIPCGSCERSGRDWEKTVITYKQEVKA